MNRVLIVEDEEFLMTALKDNLESEGYVVEVAYNGEEAMERIKAHRPNLILLDILMPKRDGFYVLEEVKKNPEWKLIPVIVLSNLGGDAEIKRALEMGADDYFVKSQHPIEEVIEKVKEYLEGRKKTKLSAPAKNEADLGLSEVVVYIQNSRKSGVTDEAIRTSLLEAGWKEQAIDKAFLNS